MNTFNTLHVDKHANYFRMCLNSLPSKAQSEESNKIALVFFCLQGLDLLGSLSLSEKENESYSNFIYLHAKTDSGNDIQYFVPSLALSLNKNNEYCQYELPSLSSTLFGLLNLLLLNSDFTKKLDRHKIMRFASKCQLKSGQNLGGFMPALDNEGRPFGDIDLRTCYIVASIRRICKYDELGIEERKFDIDVNSLIQFVLKRVCINGGLSSSPYTEAHAGLTFCGIACLRLLDFDFESHSFDRSLTVDWILHRHIDYPPAVYKGTLHEYWDPNDSGAFNGRENKFGDTCYSWWCSASLKILGKEAFNFLRLDSATHFLLDDTQNNLIGGFGKNRESLPDPYHSYLALASLALWKDTPGIDYLGKSKLISINPLLLISEPLSNFLDRCIRY